MLNMTDLVGEGVDADTAFGISKQLHEHGLIEWKPMEAVGVLDGMGRITARGVDIIESTTEPPITISDNVGPVARGARVPAETTTPNVFSASLTDAVKATDSITATLTPFSFPAEWESDRQEAIRLLRELPAALRRLDEIGRLVEELRRHANTAGSPGIGHNQPPDDIGMPVSIEEIVADATVAGDALLAEITAERPHLSSIRLAARALKRVVGWIEATVIWLAKKAGRFLDEYLKALATPAAVGTVYVIVNHLTEIKAVVTAIINPLANLFELLHFPL
jgi:hypothetical protein